MTKAQTAEAERIVALRARMEKERLQRVAKAEKAAEMSARRQLAAAEKAASRDK